MASKMIAPNVAVSMDPRLKLPVLPAKPSRLSTQPPTKAPTIPTRAVTITPPGSGPGMTHFARIPAISPITIQTTMVPTLMALTSPVSTARRCTARHPDGIYSKRSTQGRPRATFGRKPRATFGRLYPHPGNHKHREAYLSGTLSGEEALQGRPDEGQREEQGGPVEQRVHLAGLTPGEFDQDVGDEAEPYPVGDVEGQRQRQDGEEGRYRLVEVVPGDKADGGDHQEPDHYQSGGRHG